VVARRHLASRQTMRQESANSDVLKMQWLFAHGFE
jgi:hypothetical protein